MDLQVILEKVMAWQGSGVVLVVLLGLLVYLAAGRGLARLRDRELLSGAVYRGTRGAMRWLVGVTVVVLVLQELGIGLTHVVTVLLTVAGMIAIGFIAVWSILSNILCAALLVMCRNFEINDEIEIIEPAGGVGLKGTVKGFNLMYTTLSEAAADHGPDYQTLVPNNIFFQKPLRRRPAAKGQPLLQHLLTKPLAEVGMQGSREQS